MACEELCKAIVADCAVWRDPQFQRSSKVRQLRYAMQSWADVTKRDTYLDVDLARAIEACARLEQKLNHASSMEAYQCNQEQVASLYAAAEAVFASKEIRNAMSERINLAMDASLQLFGSRGVVPRMQPSETIQHLLASRSVELPHGQCHSEGWHPRWPGDPGDPFEPYMQLLEQFLHTALTFHARSLEQLSAAFGAVRTASRNARDAAYIRTQAAAVGISVKEYQRLLDMFTKIDAENKGRITKSELMLAMRRDKDIAAFMQLSRARTKDGRRESFESVFNRIDNTGMGAITWEQFLYFFSTGRSLIGPDTMCPSVCPTMAPSSPPRGCC